MWCVSGSTIQKLTDVSTEEAVSAKAIAEKAGMVRSARQLLSAITKVLILADKVTVKQLITAKAKVGGGGGGSSEGK